MRFWNHHHHFWMIKNKTGILFFFLYPIFQNHRFRYIIIIRAIIFFLARERWNCYAKKISFWIQNWQSKKKKMITIFFLLSIFDKQPEKNKNNDIDDHNHNHHRCWNVFFRLFVCFILIIHKKKCHKFEGFFCPFSTEKKTWKKHI